ncbi:serine/threonine-protein kinase [Mycobacterium sp. shizuoka-1]|uniref:serine/threonine-protein kinase n=1 Tax=Mycobacterium sp. shizuoka-1 TaxID=2039281 RepID=UPI000C05D878|nr:serine/threonine-protein kinase [Mycobacterium sp. shizuoka-1]GAY14186.1 hypothetical protein MSZK_09120 [Mycobacterium sp. shizuoka-1]
MLVSGEELVLRQKSWFVVEPLNADSAGFGDLYVVRDGLGNEAVAKLVVKDPGAERELLIGAATQAAQYRNVVPVLDDGEHGDSWVLVMPRAEKSLAKLLEDRGGSLTVDEALAVLTDIAVALGEISGALVHRDLKPQNVLLLDGSWRLADFGISRYAAATTATDTHKYKWSDHYAAPEQWRMEHADKPADIYAFGVIGYELLSGNPPFMGPDFRRQHLNEAAAPLDVGPTRLRDLIDECLYKAPESRPTASAILKRLERISAEGPRGSGLERLALANREVVHSRSEADAIRSAQQEHLEWRQRLHEDAAASFQRIENALMEAIHDNAPVAELLTESAGRNVARVEGKAFVAQLLSGQLGLDKPRLSESTADSIPFTVISESAITVNMRNGGNQWNGRGHSLWFCNAVEKERFAWYEVAFMEAGSRLSTMDPFSVSALHNGGAFNRLTIGIAQIARDFNELDRSDLSEFVNRWLGWFADAAFNTLQRPMILPEGRIRWDRWWSK